MSNQLTYRDVNGNTLVLAPKYDARIAKIVGRTIVTHSRAEADSLANELMAWGLVTYVWGISVDSALP